MLWQTVRRLARFGAGELRFGRFYRRFKDYTMVPRQMYIDNLFLAGKIAHVPGCVVECGTWRGGMIAGIAAVLGARRKYYLFDSFEGLPPAKEEVDGEAAIKWQADPSGPTYHNNCTAAEEDARDAMSRSGAADYVVVKGWFDQTLPQANLAEPIALLRMDADWYESTKCILDNLASRVAPGGMIVVDDYYTWEGCTQAVNEFAAAHKLKIRQSTNGVAYLFIEQPIVIDGNPYLSSSSSRTSNSVARSS